MEDVFVRLEGRALEKVNEIKKMMGVDYNIRGEFVEVASLFSMIEDLEATLENVKEEKEDMEREIEENYRRITPYEEIGMNERDFC